MLQFNKLKTALAEKTQMVLKVQSVLNIAELESKDVREHIGTMNTLIQDIKQGILDGKDVAEMMEQLEEVSMSIETSTRKPKRPSCATKSAKTQFYQNENDKNSVNLRKRNNNKKVIVETESVQSDSQDIISESEVVQKRKLTPKRKKVKTTQDQEMMDKATNLINEIFNI